MTSVPSDYNAFVHRDPGFDLVLDMTYTNAPGAQDAALDWLAGLFDGRWAPLMNGQACECRSQAWPRTPPCCAGLCRGAVGAGPANRRPTAARTIALPSLLQIKTIRARPTARSAPGACITAATCPG